MTGALAVAYAADRYRFSFGARIDVRTLMRWTGYSRSQCYRLVQKLKPFFDTNGYAIPGSFDESLGGWVRVVPDDVRELDANRAIVLGLLRRWDKRQGAKVARSGAVEVYAEDLARASGLHERTVRRILEELSTGDHHRNLKPEDKALFRGRFELHPKRGRAPFVKLLSKQMQLDRTNRLLADQKSRMERVAPPDAQQPAQKAAIAERQQAELDDGKDHPAIAALRKRWNIGG